MQHPLHVRPKVDTHGVAGDLVRTDSRRGLTLTETEVSFVATTVASAVVRNLLRRLINCAVGRHRLRRKRRFLRHGWGLQLGRGLSRRRRLRLLLRFTLRWL